MFQETVTTKDGHVKVVVAGSEEELAEGVAAVKGDQNAVSPDLHSPEVPNQVVSPDNLHTEPSYVQPAEPVSVEEVVQPPKVVSKPKGRHLHSKK